MIAVSFIILAILSVQDLSYLTYKWQWVNTTKISLYNRIKDFTLCMDGPTKSTYCGCLMRFSKDDNDVDLKDWATYERWYSDID